MAVSRVVLNNVAGAAAIHSFLYSITHYTTILVSRPHSSVLQPSSTVLPTYTHAQHFPPELDSLRNQETTHALRLGE